MDSISKPTGHLQVRLDWNKRTRSYYAFWEVAGEPKKSRRLDPAHVKDSGRRTSRGAVLWRAGDGPLPTPAHPSGRRIDEDTAYTHLNMAGVLLAKMVELAEHFERLADAPG